MQSVQRQKSLHNLHNVVCGSLTEHGQEAEKWVDHTIGGLGQKFKKHLKATVWTKVTEELP